MRRWDSQARRGLGAVGKGGDFIYPQLTTASARPPLLGLLCAGRVIVGAPGGADGLLESHQGLPSKAGARFGLVCLALGFGFDVAVNEHVVVLDNVRMLQRNEVLCLVLETSDGRTRR